MIRYSAVEDQFLRTYFWWAAVAAPYYIAKIGIVTLRSANSLIDTKIGKVFGYAACVLAIVFFNSLVGGSLQNSVGIFAIMFPPAMLGAYSGFKVKEASFPIEKETDFAVAQRKVKRYGSVLESTSALGYVPLSLLPYPIDEIKAALKYVYLSTSKDVKDIDYRLSFRGSYGYLSNFVPDDKARVYRLWVQRNSELLNKVSAGTEWDASLGQNAVDVMEASLVQHNLLLEEWDSWLCQVELDIPVVKVLP